MSKMRYEYVPDWLVEKRQEIYDSLVHDIHALGEMGHDDDRRKTEALLGDLFPHGRPEGNEIIEARVALVVTEKGDWNCVGSANFSDTESRDYAMETVGEGVAHEYIVVIRVPKPSPLKPVSIEKVGEDAS
jgi:hypothetical protein